MPRIELLGADMPGSERPGGSGQVVTLPLRPDAPIRVIVADDHELLRTGTRQILERAGGFHVVGEAADGETALRLVGQERPDVVLIDIRLPDGNGIDFARRILSAERPPTVLIVSAYDDDHYVRAALAAGVAGYLLKTLPADELVHLVRAALRTGAGNDAIELGGDRALFPRGRPTGLEDQSDARLTLREREVVRFAVRGLANKQIAYRLGISPRTVEGHLNRIFNKLGASSRTELVHYALVNGLFPEDPAGRRPQQPDLHHSRRSPL